MTGVRVFLSTSGSPTHFPAPTFTEVTSLLLAEGGANISQGVAGRGQEWAAGSFSFTLRNTAGTYSGPALLRRPVLLRVSVGASDIDIRGVITDITEYRDGVRRLQVSGTDILGLVGDIEVGQTWDEQLAAQSARSWWPLNEDGRDALVTRDATNVYPLTEDPPRSMTGAFLYGGDQSGQRPVYGAIEGCPALSGGGVTLEPTDATKGFAGLYGDAPPLAGAGWNVSGWIRRPSGSGVGTALTVVATNLAWSCSVGFDDAGLVGEFNTGGSWGSGTNFFTQGPSGWYWFTMGQTTAGDLSFGFVDTRGRWVGGGAYPLAVVVPRFTIVGGPAALSPPVGPSRRPAYCQVADLVWSGSSPAQSGPYAYSSLLFYGHIGYPGESVQARGDRLLTETGIIPAAGTWNGTAPPEGPTLADEPLTRRPLADALNATLDSGGFVIHDLPATSTANTSLGLLWPDALDGVTQTPTVYTGKRVLLASDGVSTTTEMLTNAATVTNDQRQSTYENTASVATYGRRAAMVTSQAEDTQAGRDYDASHASWLASREASPVQALGLPDLVLDVDGMIADGATATVVALARTGACVSIANLLPGGGTYNGIVRGLQWEHTTQGALRLTLRCQPLRPLLYALLDDTATATLDNVIVGW